jgi:hypothetical protein
MSLMTEAGIIGPGMPGRAGGRSPAPAGASREPTYEGDFVLDEHLLLDCGRTLAGPRCITPSTAG